MKSEMDLIQIWYAWHPVYTKQGRWAWLRKVIRVWNPRFRIQCLTYDDPGEYVGAWEYHG